MGKTSYEYGQNNQNRYGTPYSVKWTLIPFVGVVFTATLSCATFFVYALVRSAFTDFDESLELSAWLWAWPVGPPAVMIAVLLVSAMASKRDSGRPTLRFVLLGAIVLPLLLIAPIALQLQ